MTARTPTGKPRGRPKGCVKTGGRVAKSLDKNERQLITNKMAGDILSVYEALGGVNWLLKFAKDQPGAFIAQALSRLFPAPQKDDPDAVFNTQVNINHMTDIEIASRVAFALNKGLHAQQQLEARKDELL
ncbi:hypothetical protein NVV94_10795 [Pseudomonas sp. LS1212]|uniref:hypothetical protein n=1 Tax=Pseudomonas sp. LS1212 TaxID=2972478 RepID=UPI00215CC00C|nr:hypothetical protein [Pseudomonas sp. LS1212]UVJ45982.1 hypothetical protein NVV94_10795 [Pseudomonas sp. LS1212]